MLRGLCGLGLKLKPGHSSASDVSGVLGDIVAGAGGHVGERRSPQARMRAGRRLWSLIARASRLGGRHGGAADRRHVADGRGWSGDIDEGIEACGLVLLISGRGTGHIESWGAQEVRVECKVVSAIATAEFL